MKKLFVLLVVGLLFTSCEDLFTGGSVYICTGSGAYAYHNSSNCRGLNNCGGSIKSVSVSKAKSMGRKSCSICY
jgi:hypothetical protein